MIQQRKDPIALSNRAVQCMEDGDIRYANFLLNTALHLLIDADITGTESLQEINFSWSNHAKILRKGVFNDASSDLFLYSRGGIIERGRQPDLGPVGEERAIILYNAALAAHLQSYLTADSTLINRAKSLYILSRQVLAKRRKTGAKSILCSDFFFHVPLLNNLGHINYDLTEFALTRLYFATVKPIILMLSKAHEHDNESIFCCSDLNGMKSNVIMEMPIAAAGA